MYDDHYFKSGRKSFRFIRKKTEDRSDTEIVIPIIEPLQKILHEDEKSWGNGVDNLKSVFFMPCFCLKSVLIDKILQKRLVN